MQKLEKLLVVKENLRERVEKARAAVRFSAILQNGSVAKTISVPGTDSKRYDVILRKRTGKPTYLEAECLLDVPGQMSCPGNQNSLCYHSMAAAIYLMEQNGFQVSVAHSKEDSRLLFRIFKGKGLDVRGIELRSRDSQRSVWLVLRKEIGGE